MVSDFPERIWMSAPDIDNEHDVWFDPDEGGTEYVRADLAALRAQASEPVAWGKFYSTGVMFDWTNSPNSADEWQDEGWLVKPLYTHPAPDTARLERELAERTVERDGYRGGMLKVERVADEWRARANALADALARPTHRHKKRGTKYVLIGIGKMQAENWEEREYTASDEPVHGVSVDMREVAVYRSVDDGSLWARPREEFEDGRFDEITALSGTSDPMAEARREGDFPTSVCTAWEDCKHDGVCHDPVQCALIDKPAREG